MTITNTKSINT